MVKSSDAKVTGPGAANARAAFAAADAKRAAVAIFIVRACHILTVATGEGLEMEGTPATDLTMFQLWQAFGEPDDDAEDGFPIAVEVLRHLGLEMPHPDQVKTS